ncbi:MAG: hypothetical protein K2P92_03935 [Bdellovibrionaceae bacterium]|nr:hypothetical protein [Pseudobdellovibrionaceae bacterium]
MEDLSPTLVLIWDVLRAIEGGYSVMHGVQIFNNRGLPQNLGAEIRKVMQDTPKPPNFRNCGGLTLHQQHLLELIQLGSRGESVYETLKALETELILSCEDEISRHLALLPFKMMLPLLGLIMPALMIVLITPLIAMIRF